jgi:hypothetical protein
VTAHPVLCTGQEVRDILDGTKTQMRRVIKSAHASEVDAWAFAPESGLWRMGWRGDGGLLADMGGIRCPYGQPGDTLWVRETWHNCPHCGAQAATYRVGGWLRPPRIDGPERDDTDTSPLPPKCAAHGWRPSVHMPRWASRLTLEVVSVRVERLQAISEEDARAEGCESDAAALGRLSHLRGSDAARAVPWLSRLATARDAYRSLWESLHGLGSWNANPWVWALGLRRVP